MGGRGLFFERDILVATDVGRRAEGARLTINIERVEDGGVGLVDDRTVERDAPGLIEWGDSEFKAI